MHPTLTVKQNLELMLQDARTLRRPAAEIEAIQRQLDAFNTPTPAQIRAKQYAFLKAAK